MSQKDPDQEPDEKKSESLNGWLEYFLILILAGIAVIAILQVFGPWLISLSLL